MLNNATALSRTGFRDWLVQRVTAVIIAAYTFCILGFLFKYPDVNYAAWHAFFMKPVMRTFSYFTLVAIVGHAWVGMWTVFTDYVKSAYGRLCLQVLTILLLLALLAWGIEILWG